LFFGTFLFFRHPLSVITDHFNENLFAAKRQKEKP